MLEGVKKAHFIGIGGVGMSAIALLLRDKGITVSGSDEEVYEPMLSYLKGQNLTWSAPYAAANIPPDADLIVIGKNAKLVPESNAEVAAALSSGKQTASYPEVLAELSKDKETIVVAGSYGKSTSTALLAHCLVEAGLDPSFFIGAVPLSPATSAHLGKGSLFIIEGDEYPSSNTDHKSKFLHYHPKDLLVTPLAHDHFNVFPTVEDYLEPFKELIERVPTDGTVVINVTAGSLSPRLRKNMRVKEITYGQVQGEYKIGQDTIFSMPTTFTITHDSKPLVRVQTGLLGLHNMENIVGVGAFLLSRNLVTPEQFQKAVASFKGIKRRMERLSEATSIPVFEGFGSSYEKLRSAVVAMKQPESYRKKRLIVVFEPHTFSWRNRASLPWYDTAFESAEQVYIFEPPQDGKETQLSLKEITERVTQSGIPTFGASRPEEILADLKKNLQKDDMILLSTSGDLGGLIEKITALAEQKFPA